MQRPLQVTFRNMPHTPALDQCIRQRAKKLDRFFPRVTSCHVVVEAPHRHHRKGRVFRVSLTVTVPGEELVVSRETGRDASHENLYVAIRDGFEAASRQLETYARRHRLESRDKIATRPAPESSVHFAGL